MNVKVINEELRRQIGQVPTSSDQPVQVKMDRPHPASNITIQRTKSFVEEKESSACSVDSGVPQGSALGPLLISCHINYDDPNYVMYQERLITNTFEVYRTISSRQDYHRLQRNVTITVKVSGKLGHEF